MKRVKRLLALLLAVVLVMTSYPLVSFAASDTTIEKVSASGSSRYCDWSYDADTDTLYINHDGMITCAHEEGTDYQNDDYGYLPLYYSDDNVDTLDSQYLFTTPFRHLVVGKDITGFLGVYMASYIVIERPNKRPVEVDPGCTDVTFEEGSKCTYLDGWMFSSSRLWNIELPNSLEQIGEGCFCEAELPSIVIPDSVYSIGDSAFNECAFLEYIKFPSYRGDQEVSWGHDICSGNSQYELEVDLGETATYISDSMFCSTTISNITIPDTVTAIGEYAFEDAVIQTVNGSSAFVFPENLESIGKQAFINMYGGITSLVVRGAEGLEIPESAFYGCKSLNSVTIDGNVTVIGKQAFYDCENLKTLEICDGVKKIDNTAFADCKGLATDIIIPASVEEIGYRAFMYCQIKSLVFEEKVVDGIVQGTKSIGDSAFQYTSYMTKVVLPASLESLGTAALANSGFDEIDLSRTMLTEIPDSCFNYTKLKSIKFPENLEKIGQSAFASCEVLGNKKYSSKAYFELPETVYYIGNKAFSKAGITEFHMTSNREDVYLGIGALSGNSGLEKVTLPKHLTRISSSLLSSCGKLTDITIPASVETIGASAFSDDTSLKNITFEEGSNLKSIEEYAFRSNKALESIVLPDTVASIGNQAFNYCSGLINIILPRQIETIGTVAFANTTSLTTAIVPSFSVDLTASKLGNNGGCVIYGYLGSPVESYAKDNSIEFREIDDAYGTGYYDSLSGTFDGGTWKVIVESQKMTLKFFGESIKDVNNLTCSNGINITLKELLSRYAVKRLVFAEGVTEIGDSAFYNRDGVLDDISVISLPIGLTSIGANAFRDCNLTSITIPDTVTTIGEYAFQGNPMTGEIKLSAAMSNIPKGMFKNTQISKFTIPEQITTIEAEAFTGCDKMTEITIPDTVTDVYLNAKKLGSNPFGFYESGAKITSFKFVNAKMSSYIFTYARTLGIQLLFANGKSVENGYYNIKSENKIWEYDYNNNTLTIDGNNSYLSGDKFYYSDGTLVETGDLVVDKVIVKNAVRMNCNVKTSVFAQFNPYEIELPNTMKIINRYAFNDCTNLKGIVIPDSVDTIEPGTFKNCPNMEYAVIGGGIYSVGSDIFTGMKSLKYVEFKEGIDTINNYAFQGCVNLRQIILPDSLTTVNNYAFSKCFSVQSVTIGKNLMYVGKCAFGDLPLCETLNINSNKMPYLVDNGVEDALQIFEGLGISTTGVTVNYGDNVDTANIGNFINKNVSQINLGAGFKGFTNAKSMPNLKAFTVSKENTSFYDDNGCLYTKDNVLYKVPQALTSVEIKDGTTAIGDNAFAYTSVKKPALPNSIKTIGAYAFANSKELKQIDFPTKLETVGEYAFYNCPSLRTVSLSNAVTTIGNHAFDSCISLASILLPNSLITVGSEAFLDCISLIGIVFPKNVETIGDRALANCYELTDVFVWNAAFGENVFENDDKVTISTLAGSDAYAYARENKIPYEAYTDAYIFEDACFMQEYIYAGFVGFCTDGHGDTQYLTVYEAGCESDGYIIGVCEYCSEIVEEIHTDAIGHSYQLITSVAATETTYGRDVYRCINCGDSYCTYTEPTGDVIEKETCTVTGSVVMATSKAADDGITPIANASIIIDGYTVAYTDQDGAFEMRLETGSYEATIHYNYGIDRQIYIVVEDYDLDCGVIPVIACDWNKDGKIDTDDYNLFRLVISSQINDPSYLSYVDMNNDGYINAKDMAIIKSCMGIDKATYIYPSIVIQ
ncbi:MAG: leucine-rich repeat protein [Clostridium sp.]|nr:leucine-rich repeat protein [Clostridium sp.]